MPATTHHTQTRPTSQAAARLQDPRGDAQVQHPPSNPLPGAGRLKLFYFKWKEVTQNNLIFKIIQYGYKIQFHTEPNMQTLPSPSFSNSRSLVISSEVSALYIKTAINKITPSTNQFVSPIFDVPKKDSKDRRVILNLKFLNTFIVKTKFKLEGFYCISSLVCRGDFLVSIDLKDAYLMFSMHEETVDYLCFDWDGIRYYYQCMPFGLTSAPRIFTKVLKVVLVFLRSRSIKASAWFDDIIIAANSISLILENLYFTKLLLKSLGFIINEQKSSLSPSQKMCHLGYIWDTVSYTLSVPEEKVIALKQKCIYALEHPVSLRFLQKILGTIEAFRTAFPLAALYYRGIQKQVASNISANSPWDKIVSPSARARKDLNWWISCPNCLPPKPLDPFTPQIILTTDSSSEGWGAFTSLDTEVSGHWSEDESVLHNNFFRNQGSIICPSISFQRYS